MRRGTMHLHDRAWTLVADSMTVLLRDRLAMRAVWSWSARRLVPEVARTPRNELIGLFTVLRFSPFVAAFGSVFRPSERKSKTSSCCSRSLSSEVPRRALSGVHKVPISPPAAGSANHTGKAGTKRS